MQRNRKYEVITLPLDYSRSFLDLKLEEIKSYYQWFLNVKGTRLNALCDFLFEKSEECLSESSLNVIEMFLLNNVSAVQKTNEQLQNEIKKIPEHLKPYAKPDDYLLDTNTISICYDVGIFMGELLIAIDKNIKWRLEVDDEYKDYGQPVLSKQYCKLELNPFRVVKNLAATIYEGKYVEGKLISVFEAWKKGFGVE
jgi:hypothetical protein